MIAPLPQASPELRAALERAMAGHEAGQALTALAIMAAQLINTSFATQQDLAVTALQRRTEAELRLRQRCRAEIAPMRSDR